MARDVRCVTVKHHYGPLLAPHMVPYFKHHRAVEISYFFHSVRNYLTIVVAAFVRRKMAKERFLRPNLDVLTD